MVVTWRRLHRTTLENRPEWSLTDLGILSLGAVNVPIYTTQAVEQIRYTRELDAKCFAFRENFTSMPIRSVSVLKTDLL
jgi:long-subunit acyl-CoA synthetase (AMP-forming)